MAAQGRAPRAIVIENVVGLLTSHNGRDFAALGEALAAQGHAFGALEIDAAGFLPRSRPRVFVIATREPPPAELVGRSPFHSRAVQDAHANLPQDLAERWIWWRASSPAPRNTDLAALLEPDEAVVWHSSERTARWLDLMAALHLARLDAFRARRARAVGALYRRMRMEAGQRVQRAEARFDGLAGCLRTPRRGSSRQVILVVQDGKVRTRLLQPREAVRLIG